MNLELLEEPVLAKETAANVQVLLDMKVDSAEIRGTQADCFLNTLSRRKAQLHRQIEHTPEIGILPQKIYECRLTNQ